MLSRAGESTRVRRLIGVALPVGCLLAAGCGGGAGQTTPAESVAQRVCGGAHGAAAQLGYPVSARIVDPDPANLTCVLSGRRLRVDIVSQASTRAYTEFDTTTSHQDQVFGSGVHESGQIPSMISVPGSVVAVWIRARREIVATNATPTTSGSYLTVAVTGRRARGRTALTLALAVARATFAAHPERAS